MPLQYDTLIANIKDKPNQALADLRVATPDEIRALISQAKANSKPLLTTVIDSMADDDNNKNEIIYILLQATVENWDHEFPASVSIVSTPLLNKLATTKEFNLMGAIIYHLSPETLIRELQRDIAGAFSKKQSLYDFLIKANNRHVLMAISSVLEQATIEALQPLKAEINLLLTKQDADPKTHQLILLKHEALFEDATKKSLLDIEVEGKIEYALRFKRNVLNNSLEESVAYMITQVMPIILFDAISIDKLYTTEYISAFDENELNVLIQTAFDQKLKPLQHLLNGRFGRKPEADKVLFDAIVNHPSFLSSFNLEVLLYLRNGPYVHSVAETLFDRFKDTFEATQEYSLNIAELPAYEEVIFRNSADEDAKNIAKLPSIQRRMRGFVRHPNLFTDLIKSNPLLAGRYMEIMSSDDLKKIIGNANPSEFIENFILTIADADPNALFAATVTYNNIPASYYSQSFGLIQRDMPNPYPSLGSIYALAQRILTALKSLLAATTGDLIPKDPSKTMKLLIIYFYLSSYAGKVDHDCFAQLLDRIPENQLGLFNLQYIEYLKGHNPSSDIVFLGWFHYLVSSTPFQKQLILRTLERIQHANLANHFNYLMDKTKNGHCMAYLTKDKDKDILVKLYEIFPDLMNRNHTQLILELNLNHAKPKPVVVASTPVSVSMTDETAKLSARIAELEAVNRHLQTQNENLIAENAFLKAEKVATPATTYQTPVVEPTTPPPAYTSSDGTGLMPGFVHRIYKEQIVPDAEVDLIDLEGFEFFKPKTVKPRPL